MGDEGGNYQIGFCFYPTKGDWVGGGGGGRVISPTTPSGAPIRQNGQDKYIWVAVL